MPRAISPNRVRYIKLGEGGRWEKECVDRGIIRIGFGSADATRFALCRSNNLVFSTSGWRRVGAVGGPQKTLDLDLMLPSTGERAFVQIKSRTTSAQLADYVERLDELGPYDRMFYVFHTGEARTQDERVTVVGPEQLSELVMDAGLASWLIRKVS